MIRYLRSLMRNIAEKLFLSIREERYYTNLFTRDLVWSLPQPNHEETLRWNIIQDFLRVIRDQEYYKKEEFYILDVGCGRGWLSNLLSDHGHVIGIEPIKPVVNWANKLFPQIDIRQGVTKDLIKEGKIGHFDLIVCSEVIEHIHDKQKKGFIKELNSLLRQSGYLIITTPRKEAEPEWRIHGDPGQPIEEWLSEEELKSLLVSNNFKIQKLSRLSVSPSQEALPIEVYQLWLVKKFPKT